jgi:hypothetical protein
VRFDREVDDAVVDPVGANEVRACRLDEDRHGARIDAVSEKCPQDRFGGDEKLPAESVDALVPPSQVTAGPT